MAEVIVALDVPAANGAHEMVDRLGDDVGFVKVGLELFTREGPQVVRELRRRGLRIFLDLKLHDIPRTVEGAVQAAAALEAEFLTIHASGGRRMVEAATRAAEGSDLRLLAVTALTSLSAHELAEAWGLTSVDTGSEVLRLARLARDAGAAGVVASPLEAREIRGFLGPDVAIVTPGIRLRSGAHHDQARVASPSQAVAAGADYLVVGRAVTAAADPRAALQAVHRELAEGLARLEGVG
jgi:orotidine-5'-phosphate decarboxylase